MNIKKRINPPYQAISLVENNSVITALANDFGYELTLKNQLISLFSEGDVLVVLASGIHQIFLKL